MGWGHGVGHYVLCGDRGLSCVWRARSGRVGHMIRRRARTSWAGLLPLVLADTSWSVDQGERRGTAGEGGGAAGGSAATVEVCRSGVTCVLALSPVVAVGDAAAAMGQGYDLPVPSPADRRWCPPPGDLGQQRSLFSS